MLAFPADASAQRRAVSRAAAPRARVVVSPYYYRPYYYWPYYGASFYGPWYYGPYYQYPPYAYGRYYDLSASLRLQVTPRETEVFIDGYYAGTVDDFDGVFQRLHLEPGEHDLQLYHPGHRAVEQKVYLQPGRTFTLRQRMEPLAPGDPSPVRPTGTAPAPSDRRRSGAPPRGPVTRAPARDTGAATEFGSLALRVQPSDAEVLIDGERWDGTGDGERLVVQLPAGVHHVEIHKDGYRTYRSDITVQRGETTTINVSLNSARPQ